jgi:hypothetical protein
MAQARRWPLVSSGMQLVLGDEGAEVKNATNIRPCDGKGLACADARHTATVLHKEARTRGKGATPATAARPTSLVDRPRAVQPSAHGT